MKGSTEYSKITAIVRRDCLETVEERLRARGVRGISVSHVKGYGEYSNFYARDWLVAHARIEIFSDRNDAETIAETILDAAHSGTAGDGIVSIQPVDKVYRIRTRSEARAGEI